MPRVLVSACLLGRACRYDGSDERRDELIRALHERGAEVVPFCPEEAGGLSTPRPAAHFEGGGGEEVCAGRARVVAAGEDVTASFLEGGRQAVALATREGCGAAYLKERSPSCGCAQVHGASGLGRGCGVTTALLRRAGVATISVE